MRIKILILGLICLFSFSCLTIQTAQTPEEQNYLNEAMKTSLIFSVPKEKSEEVWGRIQSFIGRFASMKIQVATDYVVETYNPPERALDTSDMSFGYSASRTPKGEEVEFAVECYGGYRFGKTKEASERNAHILVYYALTEKLIEKFITR